MSKIYADTIETESSNVDITLGAAGDAVLIPTGATLKTNKIADAGGNNIITSDGSGNLTVDSQFTGYEVLLTAQTASDAASVSFTTKITSTYDVYCFKFIMINPATDNADFMFNGSIDGGSNYNVTKTTSMYRAYQSSTSASGAIAYDTSYDRAQSTDYQWLTYDIGSESDENGSGELWLFTPAGTTYVKHFYATTQIHEASGYSVNNFMAGYFNTTSAINAISFKMDSGNMDGKVKMYGLSST